MKKFIFCLILGVVLTGCAGPKYSGSAIKNIEYSEIVIIKDEDTRSGFLKTMETWLTSNGYNYDVIPDGSDFENNKLNLEYVGHWSWDLALYLSSARISAYNNGQRVGEVEFRSPNTLNLNKFGSAEERISYMMEVLFAKLTSDEANHLIRAQKESNGLE